MNKTEQFRAIVDDMANLYDKKNAAYGDSFARSVSRYGLIAALTRISDKFNRLETLVLNPNIDPCDEKLADTLKDLASYCVMTFMEIDKEKQQITLS